MYCGTSGSLDLLAVGVGERVAVGDADGDGDGEGVGFVFTTPIDFQTSFVPDFIHLKLNPCKVATEFNLLQLAPDFIDEAA